MPHRLLTHRLLTHRLLSRRLAAQSPGGLGCLDAVAWPAGPGRALRAFFATGTGMAEVSGDPAPGCVTVTERRAVSGGRHLE